MTDILELIGEDDDTEIIDVTDADFEDLAENAELVLADDDDQMSEMKARELTNAIKAAAEATYVLLARAHHGKAYKALGYKTWAEYVTAEFEISTQRSYQLLNLNNTIKQIEAAAPEGTPVKLTEAQARDIKRELPFITSQIAEETADLDTDAASKKIDAIVEAAREQKKLDDDAVAVKEKALQEAEEDGYRAGLEAGADAILESDGFDLSGEDEPEEDTGWGQDTGSSNSGEPSLTPQLAMDLHNLVNVLAGATALPDARDLANSIPESKRKDIREQARRAEEWLQGFNSLIEEWD